MNQITFNDKQIDAINEERSRFCIIGGPGSRKTTTLLHRIKRLINNGMVKPQYIALVTFTNNAARDMTERLTELMGGGVPPKGYTLGYAGTIHGMCLRMLQMHGTTIGYSAHDIAVLDDDAAYDVLRSVADLLGYKSMSREWLLFARDQFGSFAIQQKHDNSPERVIAATYYTRLIANNATDFMGLITETSRLLTAGVAPPWTHFFVDEYQDLSQREDTIFRVQLPRYFAPDYDGSITVIGDVDQAIYNWRGGDIQCLQTFAHENAVVYLDVNYRSDRAICDVANTLIKHNGNRSGSAIVPASTNDGHVDFNTDYESDSAEIMDVCLQIHRLLKDGTCAANDIAVLARTNAIVREARQVVAGNKIAVASNDLRPNGDFDAKEFKLLLAAVDMLATPRNDLAVYRWLRMDANMGTPVSYSKVHAENVRRQAALAQKRMCDVIELPFDTTKLVTVEQAIELLPDFVLRGTFDAFVADVAATLPPNATVADLALALRREQYKAHRSDGVTVSTMHGAKGLEWKTVFVIALEQEIIPANRKDVEEERRLLYVACTRAKHLLVLSRAAIRREGYGAHMPHCHKPSQFIAEMLS